MVCSFIIPMQVIVVAVHIVLPVAVANEMQIARLSFFSEMFCARGFARLVRVRTSN